MCRQRLAIGDGGFVLDPRSGESFSINHTGREMLGRLVDGNTFAAIVVELSGQYQLERRCIRFYVQCQLVGCASSAVPPVLVRLRQEG